MIRTYQVFFENELMMNRFRMLYYDLFSKVGRYYTCKRNFKSGSNYKYVITFKVSPDDFSLMQRKLKLKRRFIGTLEHEDGRFEEFKGWCFIN